MEKIRSCHATGAKNEKGMDILQWSEYYRANEADADLAAKQTECNNAMELLFAEQRRYDALVKDVRALVDDVKKALSVYHKPGIEIYEYKLHKKMVKLKQAIYVVEARLKEVKYSEEKD